MLSSLLPLSLGGLVLHNVEVVEQHVDLCLQSNRKHAEFAVLNLRHHRFLDAAILVRLPVVASRDCSLKHLLTRRAVRQDIARCFQGPVNLLGFLLIRVRKAAQRKLFALVWRDELLVAAVPRCKPRVDCVAKSKERSCALSPQSNLVLVPPAQRAREVLSQLAYADVVDIAFDDAVSAKVWE